VLEFEAQKIRGNKVSKTAKESEKIIIDLKTQLREARRNEEVLNKQLNEKQQDCKKLEIEIVQLKRELEKGNNQSRFEKSSKILNDIPNSQRSPNDKRGLGYYQNSTYEK
jgi:chromosome segregation ATPase